MTKITVYDPPMCCSTGVCGADVDQRLVDFAADLDWLRAQGAEVRRVSLSREPMDFVAHPLIKALMDASGGDDLPAIVVGGEIVSQGRYPARAELARFAGIAAQDATAPVSAAPVSSCCGGAGAARAPAAQDASGGCCGGGAKAANPAEARTGCCG